MAKPRTQPAVTAGQQQPQPAPPPAPAAQQADALRVEIRPSEVSIALPAAGAEASTTFEAVASGGTQPYTSYRWQRNGNTIPNETAATYSLSGIKVKDHVASFVVEVTDTAGAKAASQPAKLSVTAEELPAVWDRGFAFLLALGLTALFVLAMSPVWWLADRVRDAASLRVAFPAAVALGSVAAGLLATLAGIYVALLELRGRARAAEAAFAGARPAAGREETMTVTGAGFQWSKEAGEGIAAVLDAFGKLRNVAALLALAAALFLFGTLLGLRALPETKPLTTTTPTTGTAPSPGTTTTTPTVTTVPAQPPVPPPPPPQPGATTVG